MPSRSNNRLEEELVRFQDRVRESALAIAETLIRQELDRRLAALAVGEREQPVSVRPSAEPKANPHRTTVADPRPAVGRPGAKRTWTRESIVNELASWLASGTTIDAAFITRHGPPGLVAATRKIFGRFDGALNVAGLQVAKQYPDGPPRRRLSH